MIDRLCAWFDTNARDLPWRTKRMRAGYGALVAEMMLQQTQVSRVVERFGEFMRAFPTVRALAAADEQAVLAMWQGMGYYRRASNLHAAAKRIVRDFGGRVPRCADDLMRLPGVGRYTAGAIASIVFGEHEPIVDGNVGRVLLRLFAGAKPQALPEADRLAWTWRTAESLVERAARPGVLNEALMELGATVCVPAPAKARCSECPIARWCAARRMGLQDQIPPPKARVAPRPVHHHAIIVQRPRSNLMLLEQRNGQGMWAGMWQTPTVESGRVMDDASIMSSLPMPVRNLRKRGGFAHATTHRRIHFHVYAATSYSRKGSWRSPDNVADLPMSNAQRRVLTFVNGESNAC